MSKARVNGIEINYCESGEGFPLLLIHGFTGSLRNWALQVPVLSRNFRMVSLDLRGHGHSEKPTRPDDYPLELMAEDAYGLLPHLGIDQCYLIGHSMGGMVAQYFVLTHSEAVRALVLVDTAADTPDGIRREEQARLVEIARDEGMEAVFEEQLRSNPLADRLRNQPQLLEVWRRQFLLTSREAYVYVARAMAKCRPSLDKLHAIQVPTLIICGENDESFVGPSRRMHERIAGSELVILAGAGHTPQIEKAPDFNRVLIGFLSRVHQGVAAAGG
jgi:pimeloyl-ACP methyl ester carboxylesterase